MPEMKDNQPKIKKSGGKRAGAGRPAGSTNKIQCGEFLLEYKKQHGTTLKEDLVTDMKAARARGDFEMLFKYQTAFSKYYFSDIQQVDVTSNGAAMGVMLNLTSTETGDDYS